MTSFTLFLFLSMNLIGAISEMSFILDIVEWKLRKSMYVQIDVLFDIITSVLIHWLTSFIVLSIKCHLPKDYLSPINNNTNNTIHAILSYASTIKVLNRRTAYQTALRFHFSSIHFELYNNYIKNENVFNIKSVTWWAGNRYVVNYSLQLLFKTKLN